MMNDYYALRHRPPGAGHGRGGEGRHPEAARCWRGVLRKRCPVQTVQVTGQPVGTILARARSTRAAYIVLGSHGHGAMFDLLSGQHRHGRAAQGPLPGARRAHEPAVIFPPWKLLKAIYQRRAVRDYSDAEMTAALVQELLRAAAQAPSTMNQQPWAFAVFHGRARDRGIFPPRQGAPAGDHQPDVRAGPAHRPVCRHHGQPVSRGGHDRRDLREALAVPGGGRLLPGRGEPAARGARGSASAAARSASRGPGSTGRK